MARKKITPPQPSFIRRHAGKIAVVGVLGLCAAMGLRDKRDAPAAHRPTPAGTNTRPTAAITPVETLPVDLGAILTMDHQDIATRESHLHGSKGPVIVIPISHDNVAGRTDPTIDKILDRCSSITRQLYDTYHCRRIMIEAAGDDVTTIYNGQGKLPPLKPENYATHTIRETLNGRRWKLISAYSTDDISPRIKAAQQCAKDLERVMANASKEGAFQTPETFALYEKGIMSQINDVTRQYDATMDAIIADDPDGEKEYDACVVQRNRAFLQNATATPGATVLWVGASHSPDLVKQMKEQGISYVMLTAKGLPEEPHDRYLQVRRLIESNHPYPHLNLRLGTGKTGRITLHYKNYKK